MAIVQLQSTNPALSFIIKKNPATGMQLRSIRKGNCYGWYSSDNQYNVYFKDADNEISYKKNQNEEFEYLNLSRYNTPLFPLNAISEYFSAPLKEQHPDDSTAFEHRFFINMIHVERPVYLDFFRKHFPEATFEIAALENKSYSLTLSSHQSIYYLLHLTNVFCLFMAMFSKEYLDLSEKMFEKYIGSITIIDAPFYIRNLFVRNFLTSKANFNQFKTAIERTDRYEIDFDFGGTASQRRNFIQNMLPFDKAIVDIGCGEGFYALPFAKKIEDGYFAIDIDHDMLEFVNRKAEMKEVENISTYASFDEFLTVYNEGNVDVLLTEVIEHIELDAAGKLILKVLERVDFDYFIITTPNADFNQFYEIDVRHVDHQWEFGAEAFQTWIDQLLNGKNVRYQFEAVGDRVNQIATTQAVVIRKGGQL